MLVLHDDGTLGEYMHLAPRGVEVQPGTPVNRGDELALSGNTGFSSTPHLHFQVMTAGEDGISAQSFPFKIAVSATKRRGAGAGPRVRQLGVIELWLGSELQVRARDSRSD